MYAIFVAIKTATIHWYFQGIVGEEYLEKFKANVMADVESTKNEPVSTIGYHIMKLPDVPDNVRDKLLKEKMADHSQHDHAEFVFGVVCLDEVPEEPWETQDRLRTEASVERMTAME